MKINLLVNKKYPISKEDEPVAQELIEIPARTAGSIDKNRKILVRKEVYPSYAMLIEAAKVKNYDFAAESGYRSVEYQQRILEYYLKKEGENAYKTVALPGTSEHHTGMCLDMCFFRKGIYYDDTAHSGEYPEEYKWLHENMHNFGFILRYPLGKENITEYSYEPWHIRFMGIYHATEIFKRAITLEEYLGKI